MEHNQYETPELIASAISRGDRNAEAVLYQKYSQGILYLLERKTGDAELARDLCQEAFFVLIERLRKEPLEDPGKLVGFLHNIAVNLHIAEHRKKLRRNTSPDQRVIDTKADPNENQYRQLLRERTADAVKQLIASMPHDRDRRLLHQYYILEMEKAEICADLELSLRHFDKVLFRAKQRFKELVTGRKS